jgi:nucleoid DNA-binding protein
VPRKPNKDGDFMMRELYHLIQGIVGCSRERSIQISMIFAKVIARALIKDKILHLKGLCSFRIMKRTSRTPRVLNGKRFPRTRYYLNTRFSNAFKDELKRDYEFAKAERIAKKKLKQRAERRKRDAEFL